MYHAHCRGLFATLLLLTACAVPLAVHADIIYPIADSYVDTPNPTTNHGTLTDLYVLNYSGWVANSYLGFDVTGAVPAGKVFQSAILSLEWAVSSVSPTVSVHQVTGAWTELGITWDNQPGYAADPLDTLSGFRDGRWKWDVSAAWPGTGLLDLALVMPPSEEQMIYLSRDLGYEPLSPWLDVRYTDATDIPEPGTLGLLTVLALPGWILARKRRKTG